MNFIKDYCFMNETKRNECLKNAKALPLHEKKKTCVLVTSALKPKLDKTPTLCTMLINYIIS